VQDVHLHDEHQQDDHGRGGDERGAVLQRFAVDALRRSLRTLSRLNTWKNTKVTKAIVPATVGTPNCGSGPGA
jgi:hypothetical protein